MFALRARTTAASTPAYALRRLLATHAKLPQTYVEKVVQRHAVGLPEGKVVRAGDYVMIKPQHVMTHVRRVVFSLLARLALTPQPPPHAGQHWPRHLQVRPSPHSRS